MRSPVHVQAYTTKRTGGAHNPPFFAPDTLRELAPAERAGGEPASYVKLEGLGKIPFSNIRRPKPLMELLPSAPLSAPSPVRRVESSLRPNMLACCSVRDNPLLQLHECSV